MEKIAQRSPQGDLDPGLLPVKVTVVQEIVALLYEVIPFTLPKKQKKRNGLLCIYRISLFTSTIL